MNTATNIAELPKRKSLVEKFASRMDVDPDKLLPALKQTAFRQSNGKDVTNEQMIALLVVSNEYGLNPFTKEIFAFPDKGGIIPVVSVDGWSRIINENPQMDGIEFEYSPETLQFKGKTVHEWIECIIYRKDRSRPIRVREFWSEVHKDMAGPWTTHPNRMHRHKSEIQCARIAFGFAGIYDQDEAERILEAAPPEQTSPRTGHTQEQKVYYDQLIEKSDSVGMFLFLASLDEASEIDLYHSFEKGKKGKYQQIVRELQAKGRETMIGSLEDLETRAINGDIHGVLEILEGLPVDGVAWLSGQCSAEAASAITEALALQTVPE